MILAHGVCEFVEEHAVNFHAVVADVFFRDGRENIPPQMLVPVAHRRRGIAFMNASALRQFQYLIVVELGLEVFAVAEEIKEFEGGFLGVRDAVFEAVV